MNPVVLEYELAIMKKLLEKEQNKNQELKDELLKCHTQSRKKGRPSIEVIKKLEIIRLSEKGYSVRDIHRRTEVSLGTIHNIIKKHAEGTFAIRQIDYMYKDKLCTVIYADVQKQSIVIENKVRDMLHCAFGCNQQPTWTDFEMFLESRCFPSTRDRVKDILRSLNLETYDYWQIVQVTQGRMAEDKQWLRFK